MFRCNTYTISDKITFNFLNIEDYPPQLIAEIDDKLGRIWNGDLDADVSNISIIKSQLKSLFYQKSEAQKHGIIAEFICHLYLRSIGYDQYFLFQNLEEGSMKKGFDGLYVRSNDYWLFESKCTLPTTKGGEHNSNIGEAYRDLKKKIETKVDNDPWNNAYNHTMHRAIPENKTLSSQLKTFSNDFTNDKFQETSEHNLIPSSTIYLEADWTVIDDMETKSKLERLINRYSFKSLNVICINKKSISNFIDYING